MTLRVGFSDQTQHLTLSTTPTAEAMPDAKEAVHQLVEVLWDRTHNLKALQTFTRKHALKHVDIQKKSGDQFEITLHSTDGSTIKVGSLKKAQKTVLQDAFASLKDDHIDVTAEAISHHDVVEVDLPGGKSSAPTPAPAPTRTEAQPQAPAISPEAEQVASEPLPIVGAAEGDYREGELPIPGWVQRGSAEGAGFRRFIARALLKSRILDPTAMSKINSKLLEMETKEIRAKFEDMLADGDAWADAVLKDNPGIEQHFGNGDIASARKELLEIYRHKLISTVNAELKADKLPKLQDYEIRIFDVRKTVKGLKKEGIPADTIRAELAEIQPGEMPFELLKDIPLTPGNRQILEQTWKRAIDGLWRGSGVSLRVIKAAGPERSEQAAIVAKLLHAEDSIPQAIKDAIGTGPQTTLGKVKARDQQLLKLVIDEGAFYSSELRLDDKDLNEKRLIYVHEIKFEVDRVIGEAMAGIDADRLTAILAGMPYSLPDEPSVRREPDSFLNQMVGTSTQEGVLSDAQLQRFGGKEAAREELIKIFFGEVETRAREQYHLTETQIANLRGLREISPALSKIESYIEEHSGKKQGPNNLGTKIQSLLMGQSGLLEALKGQSPGVIAAAQATVNRLKAMVESFERKDQQTILEKFETFRSKLGGKTPATQATSWREACLHNSKVVDQVRAGEIHPSGVKNEVIADLMTLSRLSARKGELSSAEQTQLMELLDKLGNKETLDALDVFRDSPVTEGLTDLVPRLFKRFVADNKTYYKLPRGISLSALSLVQEYAKFKHQFADLHREVDRAQGVLATGANTAPKDRITYRQLSKVFKLARYLKPEGKTVLGRLKALGIKELKSPDETDYLQAAGEAVEVMEEYENLLMPGFSEHYPDGTVMGYNGNKKIQWTGRKGNPDEELTRRICDHGLTHGMKAYHKDGKLMASQVYSSHSAREMSFYEAAVSDAWEVDINALVPTDLQDQLGNIEDRYRAIEGKIHSDIKQRFDFIGNDDRRRVDAGLAKYGRLIRWILGAIRGQKIRGHQLEYEQDFDQIHAQFLTGKEQNVTQICSEFVSRSTLAAMVQLNKELAAELARDNPLLTGGKVLDVIGGEAAVGKEIADYLNDGPKWGAEAKATRAAIKKLRGILKSYYQEGEIDLIIRIRNEEILDLPYNRREDFTRIHPGRMVRLLEKKGCARRLDKPELFNKMIKVK